MNSMRWPRPSATGLDRRSAGQLRLKPWTIKYSPSREAVLRRLLNALMESEIGLYKTELIKPPKPWRGLAHVELATAEWVDWFNNRRLHTAIGDIPPR
jgi:transposase InsO family protein